MVVAIEVGGGLSVSGETRLETVVCLNGEGGGKERYKEYEDEVYEHIRANYNLHTAFQFIINILFININNYGKHKKETNCCFFCETN